eukprot:3051691-Amphidinium_carterae.1
MRLLVELKSILEPFLWALFLVGAWKPVVDNLERQIARSLATMFGSQKPDRDTRSEGELQGLCSDSELDVGADELDAEEMDMGRKTRSSL